MKTWYPEFSGLDDKSWALKMRPALSDIITPLHARHMEPSCTADEDDPTQSRNTRIPGTINTADDALGPPAPGTPSDSNSHVESNQEGDGSDQDNDSDQKDSNQEDEPGEKDEPSQELVPSSGHQPQVSNADVRQQPLLALYVSVPNPVTLIRKLPLPTLQ